MTDKRVATPYDELTYRIIGCAMAVHRARGPGHREDTYQRDLEVRFAECELSYEPQKLLEVYDSSQGQVLVGYYIPDFIVAGSVIVEIKALASMDNSHVAQAISYLAVTGCPVALLINFGARPSAEGQWRRVFPLRKVSEHVHRQWLFVPDWLARHLAQADPGPR